MGGDGRAAAPPRKVGDLQQELRSHIRHFPDWPVSGVMFQDLGGILANGAAFGMVLDEFALVLGDEAIDTVVGIESRGFVYGAALARDLGVGFIGLRKPGKLPGELLSQTFDLEYGTDELHLQVGACRPGRRVVLVDDVLATGGTALAGLDLMRRAGAEVATVLFVLEISALGGRSRLESEGVRLHCILAT